MEAHFAVRFMSRMSESSSNRRSSNSLIYNTDLKEKVNMSSVPDMFYSNSTPVSIISKA